MKFDDYFFSPCPLGTNNNKHCTILHCFHIVQKVYNIILIVRKQLIGN